MKKLLLTVFACVLSIGYAFAQDCVVSWEYDSNINNVSAMYGFFEPIGQGSTVPKGTQVTFYIEPKSGKSISSLLVNGEEKVSDLIDNTGGSWAYIAKIEEDTHLIVSTEERKNVVTYNVEGPGTFEVSVDGSAVASGASVPYGTTVSIKATPENSAVQSFTIDGKDCLNWFLNSGLIATYDIFSNTTFDIVFSEEIANTEQEVSWNVTGNGTVEVTTANGTSINSGDKVKYGDAITIQLQPADKWEVSTFTINGKNLFVDLKADNSYTYTVRTQTTIEAGFTEIPVETGEWSDYPADSYESGSGTQADPYKIATAEQLAKLSNDANDGTLASTNTYFELVADIDLAGNYWTPVGHQIATAFDGTFDGKGHKISNLLIHQASDNIMTLALFGRVGTNGIIRNLIIESGEISGNICTAAIAGFNQGTIEDCINKANVSCEMMYTGGIAGGNYNAIRRCENYGTVLAGKNSNNGMSAGGIVGTNSVLSGESNTALLEECANFGEITTSTGNTGGIAGSFDAGTIRNCYNRGKITGPRQIGGLVGQSNMKDYCDLRNSYSAGQINITSDGSAGGIIGDLLDNGFAFTYDALFHDTQFATYAVGNAYIDFDETPMGRTADEMKSSDFVKLLCAGDGTGKWIADKDNVNDGYPVLGTESVTPPGGINDASETNFKAIASGNRIIVTGIETTVSVYSTSGLLIYDGTADGLASKAFANGIYLVAADKAVCKVIVTGK